MLKYFFCLLLCFTALENFAQIDDRLEKLEIELEDYSKQYENLRKKIDISAAGSIKEIVTAVAQQTQINITIDPSINEPLVSNFTKVQVRDLLLYLCRQYNLDLKFSGSIITITRYNTPPPTPTLKELGVKYNSFNGFLSLDLVKDTLQNVLRDISQKTGQNVLPSKLAKDVIVNAYIDKAKLEDALALLASANDLKLQKTKEGAFFISTKSENPDAETEPLKNNKNGFTVNNKNILLDSIPNLKITTRLDTARRRNLVSVEALGVPFLQILKGVSMEMKQEYFLFENNTNTPGTITPNNLNPNNNPNNQAAQNTGSISLKVQDVTYEEFLEDLLKGSALTYKLDNDVYLIGQRDMEGLRQSKLIQLQYRSALDIDKVIPKELLAKVNMQPFLELNAILLNGSLPAIQEVESFLKGIDKLVPVVTMELIIMDVQRSRVTETGIEAGLGQNPATNQANLSPGLGFTFNARAINRLLDALAGRGIVNLGQVVPNFYLSLKATEDIGLTNTHSRPQLSTLNSHEASFKINETRYYQETRTTVQGVQGTITQRDVQFKSVQANFGIVITPYVSGDEHITLNVSFEQSDFLGELQVDAPPAQTTRSFTSKIRVKNGEMIVLGGLETKRTTRTNKGIPFFARIPILNLIGSRKNSKTKSELLIFIKPIIVY